MDCGEGARSCVLHPADQAFEWVTVRSDSQDVIGRPQSFARIAKPPPFANLANRPPADKILEFSCPLEATSIVLGLASTLAPSPPRNAYSAATLNNSVVGT